MFNNIIYLHFFIPHIILSGMGVISVGLPWPRKQSIILHLHVLPPGTKTSRLNSNFLYFKDWSIVVLCCPFNAVRVNDTLQSFPY